MSLQILKLDSWCFSLIKINILSTVDKLQATVSFFKKKKNEYSVFFQKKDKNTSGERSEVYPKSTSK
jgi:hypothetical protein